MNTLNPYAPPQTDISLEPHDQDLGGVWRDGKLLVMAKDAALPDRCLKCNLPANGGTLRRKLSWHPPFWYLLLFFNVIIYCGVALLVRKTATVSFPLCEVHRKRRLRSIAVGWLFSLLGIAVMVAGIAGLERSEAVGPLVILAGVLLLFVGIISGLMGAQVAVPHKIDKRFVWLKKAHPEFLAALPPWTS
jgi:uncharacterized membrane protein